MARPLQDRDLAPAEVPPIMQSQGSAMRKPFVLRASAVVFVLILIAGLINWRPASRLFRVPHYRRLGSYDALDWRFTKLVKT
jgi:hypothetical protein